VLVPRSSVKEVNKLCQRPACQSGRHLPWAWLCHLPEEFRVVRSEWLSEWVQVLL